MINIVCDKCKHEFSIFEKKCPNCGDKVKTSTKFYCNDCGNEIDIYEKICKKCNKIPEKVIIKQKDGEEIVADFEYSEEESNGLEENYQVEEKEDSKTTKNNKKQNKKFPVEFLLLSLVAAIITVIRLMYLFENGRLTIGIIAVVVAVLTLVSISNKTISGILGIITGILMLITGSFIGGIIGALLIIDSIKVIVKK